MLNQKGLENTAPLKILVVDDIKENRRLFELSFESLKKDLDFLIELTCVDSAEEALKVLEKQKQDLILCDERLGGMYGTQLYAEVAKTELTQGFVPFLIISAKSSPKDWMDFYRAGVMDFLPKPVQPEKLRFVCRAARRIRDMRNEILRLQKFERS
ncbi:MAG: response regulator [Bdellovibrionales bacterium]|nr:response regulator [Bdellovibrionales bacterium]